jgi:hypothetical protein
MPDVDLVAKVPFSYATRRLQAGDTFTVPANMARVLVGIGKAEAPREFGKVPRPPAKVFTKAIETTPKKAEEPKAEPKKTPRKRTTRKAATKK